MRPSLRIVSLVIATVCAVFFPISVWFLFSSYNYTHRRFPPYVTLSDFIQAVIFGFGLVGSIILFRRTGRQVSK
jgi:ABC-type thiamin/hydroxymethylpyrimidine transport system permease subunit